MKITNFFKSGTMKELEKKVEQSVKKDLPGILNKKALTRQAELQKQLDELGETLTLEQKDVLNKKISEIMEKHLSNSEIHGLAKKQLQKPEDLAKELAYESVIRNPQQILKDHVEQQGRDNLKELMKKAGIWKGDK